MPATKTQRYVQKAWVGGMNTFFAEDSVSQNQAFLLSNIAIMDRPEAIIKMSGGRKILKLFRNSLFQNTTVIENMFHFTKNDGTSSQLVAFSDPEGFHLAHFMENSFTVITPNSTPYALPVKSWIAFSGTCYFVTGENAVFKWDGVSATYDRITLPLGFTPTIIEMYNGRAYYAGHVGDPSRIIFSKPLLPDQFNTPTDFVDVMDSLGDGIVDLKPLGNTLVVLKKRSIHQIIGSPPREVREFAAIGVGAVHRDTVQRTQIGLVFLSELGVYTFNGQSLDKISLAIEPTIQTALNDAQNNYSSVYYKNVYYLFNQNSESVRINVGASFALDTLQLGVLGITVLQDFNCKHNIVLSSFDAKNDWLCALDKSNVILKMNNVDYPFQYRDESNQLDPIVSEVITHWEDFGDPTVIKEIRALHFFTQRPLVDVKYVLEWSAYGRSNRHEGQISSVGVSNWNDVAWNKFNWELDNKYHYKVILPPSIDVERCRLHLTSDNSTEFFNLLSFEYHFVARRLI